MGYTPHVLVIGGGVLGTGVARDLAIRGLDVTLVTERGLGTGTTRGLGVIESGARHSSDEALARLLYRERQKLGRIAGDCIENTGGLVVSDSPAQGETLREAADAASIPTDTIENEDLRERELGLSGDVDRAVSVPDAVVDPFTLTLATGSSAREYGATLRTHTTVTDISVEEGTLGTVSLRHDPSPEAHIAAVQPVTDGGQPGVPGGEPDDAERTMPGEAAEESKQFTAPSTDEIDPDYVVNAVGGRADEVASLAGLELGRQTVVESTLLVDASPPDTVVTYRSSDGEDTTVMPRRGRTAIGRVRKTVTDDREAAASITDVRELEDRASEAVPTLQSEETLRADSALSLQCSGGESGHDHELLDHGDRDDCWGMTTIVGGSLTTHRYVAEQVADDVCAKFGIRRECQTDEIPLPTVEPLGEASDITDESPVVCDSLPVTQAEIEAAFEACESPAIEEATLRLGTEFGSWGESQCAYRVASALYPEYDESVVATVLQAFLDEHWETQRPVLRGETLESATKTYRSYVETMALGDEAIHREDSQDDEAAEPGIDLDSFADGRETASRARPLACERPTGGELSR